jgi:hypothetical protein
MRHNIDTKQIPYWKTTIVSYNWGVVTDNYGCSGDLAPRICAPLDKGTYYASDECIYIVWQTYLMLYNSLRTPKHEKVIASDVAICLRQAASFHIWQRCNLPQASITMVGAITKLRS